MKILFVTRKFPPSVGGMENAAYELYKALQVNNDVTLVSWGGTNKWLPIVYPWLTIKSLLACLKKQDVIYLQDGLMAPLGAILKFFTGKPTLITLHGLEVTFGNKIYQSFIKICLRPISQVVAISQVTRAEIHKRLPGLDVKIINNGVKDVFYVHESRDYFIKQILQSTQLLSSDIRNKKVLVTSGRLVRRKGVAWFVNNVVPKMKESIGDSFVYLIAGAGEDRQNIEDAIKNNRLETNVKLLGRVSQPTLLSLYNCTDLFIMPNIPTKKDMEGFGLVALEASSCGTVVLASNIEGITDAIKNGKNGFLIEALNADAYKEAVLNTLNGKQKLDKKKVGDFVIKQYSWDKTARQYTELMKKLIS